MTKDELKRIKEELFSLNRFNKLFGKFEEFYPPADSFIFEVIFAYVTANQI